MARRAAIPHHQVGRAILGLRAGHVELEHGHPHFVPGPATVGGVAVRERVSGSHQSGSRRSLQVIPARGVFR